MTADVPLIMRLLAKTAYTAHDEHQTLDAVPDYVLQWADDTPALLINPRDAAKHPLDNKTAADTYAAAVKRGSSAETGMPRPGSSASGRK